LHVSAKEKNTGKEAKITIKANSGLNEDEIQRMVKDAELHAEEDKKVVELAASRNNLEAIIASVKRSLSEHGDKLSADEKANIENALNKAEEAAKGNDKSAMEAEATKLMEAAQQLAQYAAASQASGTTDASGESDVVDAEFEEVKDKDQKA
jgi:molecular chaperone DnaK